MKKKSLQFVWFFKHHLGCIHLLNTGKYCDNTRKYCGNTHKYWPNTWKMCSPTSTIFTSIVTIIVSFEAILMYYIKACSRSLLWNWLLKMIFTANLFIIASKTYHYCDDTHEYCTCRWTQFSSIGSIRVSFTTILTSIVITLTSIEQVNTP